MRAQDGDQIRVLRASCGVVINRGRRSGGVGGDVVLSDLSDQGVLTKMWSINSLRPRYLRLKRWASGMRGARFHSRCASPLSGWSKPPVAISEPVGPLRIWVVAASTSSLRSPSTITELFVGHSSAGPWQGRGSDGFGCSAIERVGAEPGAFALVLRAESAIGKGQQLGFEMGGDEVDVGVLDVDPHVERGRPMVVVFSAGLSPC